ncbi:BgTH12-05183 [Blumeria graminis f. sp. triticale]|uniref:BgtE-20040 n=3 Tax=Blumeria graminis TaxID=34373 RepID=A0A381LAZ8_BLUGR|nr:BgTH12-05183 [Blumeria graminis f. sp. triticale]VDB88009.1 BgtE-20040 [Blumeria graminis f. sp. tritici]
MRFSSIATIIHVASVCVTTLAAYAKSHDYGEIQGFVCDERFISQREILQARQILATTKITDSAIFRPLNDKLNSALRDPEDTRFIMFRYPNADNYKFYFLNSIEEVYDNPGWPIIKRNYILVLDDYNHSCAMFRRETSHQYLQSPGWLGPDSTFICTLV